MNIGNGAIFAQQIAASTITGANIAGGTITATNIQAGTITGTLIAGNTITGNNIVGGSIYAASIAAGTITTTQIAANTITAGNLNVSTLSAISANIGSVTAGLISNGGSTYFDLTNGRSQWLNANGYVTRLGNIASGIVFWAGNPSTGIGSESTTNGIMAITSNGIYFGGIPYYNGAALTTTGTTNGRVSNSQVCGSGNNSPTGNYAYSAFQSTKTVAGYIDGTFSISANGSGNPFGTGTTASGVWNVYSGTATATTLLASGTWGYAPAYTSTEPGSFYLNGQSASSNNIVNFSSAVPTGSVNVFATWTCTSNNTATANLKLIATFVPSG